MCHCRECVQSSLYWNWHCVGNFGSLKWSRRLRSAIEDDFFQLSSCSLIHLCCFPPFYSSKEEPILSKSFNFHLEAFLKTLTRHLIAPSCQHQLAADEDLHLTALQPPGRLFEINYPLSFHFGSGSTSFQCQILLFTYCLHLCNSSLTLRGILILRERNWLPDGSWFPLLRDRCRRVRHLTYRSVP